MPMSAISFSRSQIQRSSPSRPGLAWRGARLVEDLKCALPKPPLPPSARRSRCPSLREIGDQRLVVLGKNLRADGDAKHDIRAFRAGHVAAHAVAAGLRLEVLPVAVVDQRVQPVDRLRPDIAAAPAVAAVRVRRTR